MIGASYVSVTKPLWSAAVLLRYLLTVLCGKSVYCRDYKVHGLFQKSKLPYYNQIEMILVTYVFPDLTSEHGYLRAKVCVSIDYMHVIFCVQLCPFWYPLPSTRHHLEVKREYYQNCSVLDCVTQCSQSAAHLYKQFLQVQQIGFVTLEPLRCA